jgi:hypothetical protein
MVLSTPFVKTKVVEENSPTKEDSLKRVVGLVEVSQDLPANPQDHRTMACYKCLERLLRDLIVSRQEAIEQLTVAERGTCSPAEDRFQILVQPLRPNARHRHRLLSSRPLPTL